MGIVFVAQSAGFSARARRTRQLTSHAHDVCGVHTQAACVQYISKSACASAAGVYICWCVHVCVCSMLLVVYTPLYILVIWIVVCVCVFCLGMLHTRRATHKYSAGRLMWVLYGNCMLCYVVLEFSLWVSLLNGYAWCAPIALGFRSKYALYQQKLLLFILFSLFEIDV